MDLISLLRLQARRQREEAERQQQDEAGHQQAGHQQAEDQQAEDREAGGLREASEGKPPARLLGDDGGAGADPLPDLDDLPTGQAG